MEQEKIQKITHKKVIAIIGLMGVGKTTIGAKLAKKLQLYFVDCDQEIEDAERHTIKEIFAQKGEKYFREVERKTIKNIVLRDEAVVLSLGGGAFENKETQEILREKAVIIWLHARVDTILHRIGNKSTRPLLNQENKRDILEKLVKERYPAYSTADLNFNTAEDSQDLIINKIIQEINGK